MLDRHHGAIGRAVRQLSDARTTSACGAPGSEPAAAKVTASQRRSQAAYSRRRDRYEEASRLRAAVATISAIATSLGAERKTVRRWLRAGGAPLWKHPPRAGILVPWHAYMGRRWAEGCRNASLLWREMVELGFTGRPGMVLQWAARRRDTSPRTSERKKLAIPSTCSLARLVMAEPATLSKLDRDLVLHLLEQLPTVADAIAVAKRLNALLRRTATESLGAVLDAAAGTPLQEFAAGLRRDRGAIQAALDLPWTTSPVEGQVNRLKMLKRSMYGRAGFQLLRARILHAT